MPNFGMAEQYGIPCADLTDRAWKMREEKRCPFISSVCKKAGGVCSITNGVSHSITCPYRFRENNLLYEEACRLIFGTQINCIALGEISFLKSFTDPKKSIGSIDNVLIQLDGDKILDWFGLEIQAVYFSGSSMNAEIKTFESQKQKPFSQRKVPVAGSRRPDYRSSGPKRLLPQLETKVPALRRWGKRMLVAVDLPFFEWMPPMKAANHISNSDVCWMVFKLDVTQNPYQLVLDKKLLTTLEESRIGLVGGKPSTMPDFEGELVDKMNDPKKVVWRS